MRFELTFTLKELTLPLDFRKGLIYFFKSSLDNYDNGSLTFSTFVTPESFLSDKILLKNNRLKVLYSVESQLLGFNIFKSLLKKLNKSFPFFNNRIRLVKIKKLREKRIKENIVKFKTLSPIIVTKETNEGKNWYYLLNEEGVEILKNYLINSLKDRFLEKDLRELEIKPIEVKKSITIFYGKKLLGSLGVVEFKGNKDILTYLYKSGISTNRRSAGFGMVDIIK